MEESPQQAPHEPQQVARRLRALREALGLTKADFADMIEVDRSSYTKIENGTKPMLPYVAFNIYRLFGVDMNFVYLGQVGGVPSSLSKKLIANLNGQNA